MTQGRRRTKGEETARGRYKEFLKRDMHDLEKRAFHSAFGMGWKQGKKRQRQINREEINEEKLGRFKLIVWAQSDDENWIDNKVKELGAEGYTVEKRKLGNNEFKFGVYIRQKTK